MIKGYSKVVIKANNQFHTFKGNALLDKKLRPVRIDYVHNDKAYALNALISEVFKTSENIEVIKEITGKKE